MPKNKWIICPGCDGEGRCVNPAIDGHGLTSADFADDPDFADDYFNGRYDESCRACAGTGKVRETRMRDLRESADDRRLAAREDGDSEAYSTAGDYRWGA